VDGTPFGRYRLVEVLGRGGMGEVWRAFDTGTDRVVALKVLPANLAQDPSFEQRFRREAHAAARLHNPHVVPIHDYGEIDGRLFVDMRLIDGRDLQAVLTDGPLEPAKAVAIVEQVARALQAAHKAGLIHRDVKPSNILLDEDDYAYLIDFGIARVAAETRVTNTGATIGTWAYMAPERFTTDRVEPSCDIYALACVLHECLTGTQPYPGDSLERQIAAHLTSPPPRPSLSGASVSAAFDAVIARGMAKDPDQRYSTTIELAHAARNAITTPLPQLPGPPPAQSPTVLAPKASEPPAGQSWPGAPHGSPAADFGRQALRPSDMRPARRAMTPVVVAILAAAVIIGAAVLFLATRSSQPNPTTSGSSTSETASRTGFKSSEVSESGPPTTTPPASSASQTTPHRPNGDLGLSTPMSRPACDGTGIVVLGNATNPGSYASDVQRFLDQYPGASYLRTDTACPSLRQSLNGNPIYAVYRVAGQTEADICAAVRAAGGDAYGKWLDTSSDPNSYIRQSCFR
jgi:serine/threonine protein kinase